MVPWHPLPFQVCQWMWQCFTLYITQWASVCECVLSLVTCIRIYYCRLHMKRPSLRQMPTPPSFCSYFCTGECKLNLLVFIQNSNNLWIWNKDQSVAKASWSHKSANRYDSSKHYSLAGGAQSIANCSAVSCSWKAMDAEHRTRISRESDSLSKTILQIEQHGRCRRVDATRLIIQFTYLALTPFFRNMGAWYSVSVFYTVYV